MGASRKTYSFEMVEIWLFDISTIYKIFPIKSRKPIKSLIFLQFEIWLLTHARAVMNAPSMNQPIQRSLFLSNSRSMLWVVLLNSLFPLIQYHILWVIHSYAFEPKLFCVQIPQKFCWRKSCVNSSFNFSRFRFNSEAFTIFSASFQEYLLLN